ncbi:MAG: SH3 domain-containing protein [Elusimicrobiota bacterium]
MRLALLAAFFAALPASAGPLVAGPEFLSVKTPRANVRESPDKKAPILWYVWKLMPVEVVAYQGRWVKVRDLDGDEGWMAKETLGSVPTVMVSPRKGAPLRKAPGGKTEWILERGYSLRVFAEKDEWLEVSDLSEASGWILKSEVWGAPAPRAP